MALLVHFDDEQRWKICARGQSLPANVVWTDDRKGVHQPAAVEYTCTFRARGWPWKVVRDSAPLELGDDGRWTATHRVHAGRLWARSHVFSVAGTQQPPHRARLRTIPRRSARAASLILFVCLALVGLVMAGTLASLHLNVSSSQALSGLSGLTLVGIGFGVVKNVSSRLRTQRVPLFGLGYLLGRTLFVCAAGMVAALLGTEFFLTTIENTTEAPIGLQLANAPKLLELRPGQKITLVGLPGRVARSLAHSLTEPKRFCVVDAAGEGVGDCDPNEQVKAEPLRWFERGTTPSTLRLGCRREVWKDIDTRKVLLNDSEGVEIVSDKHLRMLPLTSVQATVGPTAPVVYRTEVIEKLRMKLDNACKVKANTKAYVALRLDPGTDFSGEVRLPYPQTESSLDESAQLVLERQVNRGYRIETRPNANDAEHEGNSPAQDPLPLARLRLSVHRRSLPTAQSTGGRTRSNPVRTHVGPGEAVLRIAIGEPGTGKLDKVAEVDCRRFDLDSQFELVELGHHGTTMSRLLSITANSAGVPGWRSKWRNAQSGGNIPPLLCAAWNDVERQNPVSTIDAADTQLELRVDFPYPNGDLGLTIPARLMGRRVRVTSASYDGSQHTGILHCLPRNPEHVVAYELRVFWPSDRNEAVRAVSRMDVTQPGAGNDLEPLWRSHWRTESATREEHREAWFPPWACRPLTNLNEAADPLGENGSAPSASLEVGGRARRGMLEWERAGVKLEQTRARVCRVDAVTSQSRSTCPKPCKLSRGETRRLAKQLGLRGCKLLTCVEEGRSCPR